MAALTPEQFSETAERHYGYLVDHGFVGPTVNPFRVVYTSGSRTVEILYAEHERQAFTIVDALVGDRNPRAGLSCLYVEAGLGPAQRIHQVARSRRLLERALESQAAALRELLPLLAGPPGESLLLRCHGSWS